MDTDKLIKKPFVRYNLEKTDDILKVRLNPEEREQLERFKLLIQEGKDSTAIKIALIYAENVLHNQLGDRLKIKIIKENSKLKELEKYWFFTKMLIL